jgi:hypothetical protein
VYRKADKVRTKVFAAMVEGVTEKDMNACLKVLHTMNDNANSGDAK